MPAKSMEDLVSLCKRRGFIFQSGELYGGLKGMYDFGPLGTELKNNLKQSWWRFMVYNRDDVEGLDSSIIGSHKLFKYSGHVDSFNDPLTECKECHARMRTDKMKNPKVCENCGSENLMEPRAFNMMFKTNFGPMEDNSSVVYLRPETCQHIFANFKNVMDSTSRKPPFGIAQIGKAFRNEIIARNFIFRVREFEQLELEFFVKPGDDEEWYDHWQEQSLTWWKDQGLTEENLKLNILGADDLPHYAKRTVDVEYKFPHGFDEIESLNNRTDYDLGNHTKAQSEFKIDAKVKENTDSNTKMAVQDIETKEWYIPYVIEASMGLDRALLAVMNEAYTEEDLGEGKVRTVLKFKKHLAPIKIAVVPLKKNNEKIVEQCQSIKQDLMKLGIGRVFFENTGNIGKAYRRHDEVGTPICVTVDFDTIEQDGAPVTIRDRDTMEQTTVPLAELKAYIQNYFAN